MCAALLCARVMHVSTQFPLPSGKKQKPHLLQLGCLCSLAFSLLCALCSYVMAAEKEELSSLQSLWKFISSKEYWKTSVEFAVLLLNLGSGTIKGIR